MLLLCAVAIGQTPTAAPDCGGNAYTLTSTGSTPNLANLGNVRCTTWTLSYYAEGFSGVSVSFQQAPNDGGSPGSFTAVSNITVGTNPLTAPTQAFLVGNTYAPWLKAVATLTGTGSITIKIDGWRGDPH
jgi:hypothetical protein